MNSSRRAALIAALLVSVSPYGAMAQTGGPKSPIEHVIVIVGENHTFDNVLVPTPRARADRNEPSVAGYHRRGGQTRPQFRQCQAEERQL